MVDPKRKKKIDEMVKRMKESKCGYPECKEKSIMTCALQVVRPMEDGSLKALDQNEQGSIQIPVPFCSYHVSFAIQGLCAVIEKDGQHFLDAPFDMIAVAEAVISAKKMDEESKRSVEEDKVKS